MSILTRHGLIIFYQLEAKHWAAEAQYPYGDIRTNNQYICYAQDRAAYHAKSARILMGLEA